MTPMLGSKLRRGLRCSSIFMRLRPLLTLFAAILAMGLVAGCGDDGGGKEAGSSTDVDQLLKDTFSGSKDVKSGKFDLALDVKSGGETGSVAIKVAGPFESQGTGKLPKLDIDASFEGGGQSIKAGVTSTGDRGFVSFSGTDYEVSGPIWKQFKASFEEAGSQGDDQSLATLGIDPRKWLVNAKNAGEAKVGDTDTVKITGDVDVPKLLDDVSTALEKLRTIGGAGAESLPEQLTAEQKQQAVDAIKDLSVEIYTGADDKILRRMLISMKIDAPAGTAGAAAVAADVKLDLQLLDLNEDQEIEAPSEAKPFEELTAQLGALGLGGLGLGAGSGSGSGSVDNLETYSACIQDAAGDNDKIRKCADLLAAP
jgi:outer membrane murein-binding lipoprotein Lpp